MVRLKNRYLLVDVAWKDGKLDETIAEQQLLQALRDSVAQNFGDYGLGRNLASLQVKYFSPYTGVGIVRCATAEQDKVVTALAFLTDIKQLPATVRVVRISGTLATGKAAALQLSEARLAARTMTTSPAAASAPSLSAPAAGAGSSARPYSTAAPIKLGKQQLAAAEQLHRLISAVEL